MKVLQSFVVTLLGAASLAQAQVPEYVKVPTPMEGPSLSAASAPVMTDGVVHSVDAAKGVVTLKHGDIVNVQMPAMTMAYGVADKRMLGQLKAGDKVKFHVDMLRNVPTVTRIELSR